MHVTHFEIRTYPIPTHADCYNLSLPHGSRCLDVSYDTQRQQAELFALIPVAFDVPPDQRNLDDIVSLCIVQPGANLPSDKNLVYVGMFRVVTRSLPDAEGHALMLGDMAHLVFVEAKDTEGH